MSATSLDHDLQTFAVELFERSGGVADWPVVGASRFGRGAARCRESRASAGRRVFAGHVTASPGTLQVGLAGEFLDVAARVLEVAVPRDGSFCIPERYLTSRDLADKVDQHVRLAECPRQVPHGRAGTGRISPLDAAGLAPSQRTSGKRSSASQSMRKARPIVELPDVFQEPDLRGEDPASRAIRSHYATAVAEGKRRLIDRVGRIRSPRRTAAGAGPQAVAGLLSSPVARSGRVEASRGGGPLT